MSWADLALGVWSRLEPVPPAPEVRRRAEEILERDEFHRSRSLLQRFLEWLAPEPTETPTELRVGGGSAWAGPIGTIILWVVIVLLVLGLAVLIARVVRSRRPRPKKPTTSAPVIDIEEDRDADEWASDAERFEAAGDWKEALRCRYRELVARLVELGDVSPMAGRTTGELARDVAATVPEVAAAFAELTTLFELPWYAHADTGPAENARFRALAEQVLGVAERSRRERTGGGSLRPDDAGMVGAAS